MKQCLVIILMILLCTITVSCGGGRVAPSNSASESKQTEKNINSYQENTNTSVWAKYPADIADEKNPINWVVWTQNTQSKMMSNERAQAINDRLHELGIEENVRFTFVSDEEGITPQSIQELEGELGFSIDFFSFTASSVRFDMSEWSNLFADLESELKSKNGRLKEFYQQAPPEVWSANVMADGYYNFSYTTKTIFPAMVILQDIYTEHAELWDQLGEATSQEELEEILSELKEKLGYEPLIYFHGPSVGTDNAYPYVKNLGVSLSGNLDKCIGSESMIEGIGFDFETGLFNSYFDDENWLKLVQTQREWYEQKLMREYQGYFDPDGPIRASVIGILDHPRQTENNLGKLLISSYKEENMQCTMIPIGGKTYIMPDYQTSSHFFSCMMKGKDTERLLDVLNIIGSDTAINYFLNMGLFYGKGDTRNQYDYGEKGLMERVKEFESVNDVKTSDYPARFTMGAAKLRNLESLKVGMPVNCSHTDSFGSYEYLSETYQNAEAVPYLGFLLNPGPAQELLDSYLKRLSLLGSPSFVNETTYQYQWDQRDQMIETIQQIGEQENLDAILEEMNQQWTAWRDRSK